MATKIGNDYMVWVAANVTTPVWALFGGQQSGTLAATRQTADASHKTSGGVALKVPGLRDYAVDLDFVADLPDVAGYGVVETAYKSGVPIALQIRKGGAGGATPADVVFWCNMYVLSLSPQFPLNGVVTGSVRFEPAVAPQTDLTLA